MHCSAAISGEIDDKSDILAEIVTKTRKTRHPRNNFRWKEMQMRQPQGAISLAGSRLGEVRHICAFFANDDEEYRVLLPFIREGLCRGDKTVNVVNPEAREEHLQRLARAGMDSDAPLRSGQLQIRINTEVYLRNGRFDQDRMLAAFEEMASSARSQEGFPMSRIVCRMDWASGDRSRIDDVMDSNLAYDGNGHLTNITDVAGNSSALIYDENDWVTNLATPYGTTGFSMSDGIIPNGRSVLVTRPDGGHEFYFCSDYANGIANSYAASQIPNTSPFTNSLDTNGLNLRNTFYWGPRQYANLSTTNIWGLNSYDFRLARMRHWLLANGTNFGSTISMERDPSPDTGGTVEGQKTWYDYAGKTNNACEGTQIMPLFTAHVLPDGTTSFIRTDCNAFGATTNEVSTYSVSGGVLFRTNSYVYDLNGIDLLAITNALGVQVANNSYNAYHEVTANYDALNELTAYTYDSSNRLTSVIHPNGLVTTNIYGADDFLAQQIDKAFATNSYTYLNDLVLTHADPRGLTVTNTWDALNRLTSTRFPDGTFITNIYSKLDLVQTIDRMGFTNSFGYDPMRRKIAETNALGNATLYNYCACGSLESIQDAANNTTTFSYDNQGNLTNTLYADGLMSPEHSIY